MVADELKSKLKDEKEFLNKLHTKYTLNDDPQTKAMREYAFKIIEPYINKSGKGVELGCSDGYFTEMLASRIGELHVVDGSTNFIEQAKQRGIPNVSYTNSLFEEFDPPQKYDYVFASYIMEHVLEPALVMNMVHRILKPDGLVYIVVPNARALSRQLALHMGLYKDLKELTENDLRFGHRRVYDRVSLNKDIDEAGFTNVAQGGIMLKILADFQMDKLINEGILKQAQLDGLLKLGFEYPDLSGSLFSICKKK